MDGAWTCNWHFYKIDLFQHVKPVVVNAHKNELQLNKRNVKPMFFNKTTKTHRKTKTKQNKQTNFQKHKKKQNKT